MIFHKITTNKMILSAQLQGIIPELRQKLITMIFFNFGILKNYGALLLFEKKKRRRILLQFESKIVCGSREMREREREPVWRERYRYLWGEREREMNVMTK